MKSSDFILKRLFFSTQKIAAFKILKLLARKVRKRSQTLCILLVEHSTLRLGYVKL